MIFFSQMKGAQCDKNYPEKLKRTKDDEVPLAIAM